MWWTGLRRSAALRNTAIGLLRLAGFTNIAAANRYTPATATDRSKAL
jgi:hypothetical protein